MDAISGHTSVANAADFALGSTVEDDTAFLARARSLIAGLLGRNHELALSARLEALEHVDHAIVYSNRTNTADASTVIDGAALGPGEVAVVLYPETVDTDELDAIADVLWTQGGGLPLAGDQTRAVEEDGIFATLTWSWVDVQEVYLDAVLTLGPEAPADAQDQVAAQLLAAGNLLTPGDDARRFPLACAGSAGIPGIIELDLRLLVGSAPGSGDTADLAITPIQLARFDAGRITTSVA